MTQKGIQAVRTSQTSGGATVQKRIQEIRRVLRKIFKTKLDPVPFKRGLGYETAFRLELGSTFRFEPDSAFD